MWILQNESLTTLRSTELIHIAYFYAEIGNEKYAFFLWLYKLIPILFEEDFLGDIYDFYKQKMWNVTVDDMPLKWYKRNWYGTYGLSEKLTSLLYAFLFCRVYVQGLLANEHFIHFMHCLWKKINRSRFFNEFGKLFQITGPE